MHIQRRVEVAQVLHALRSFPVVGLVGPRQVGKSTLAQDVGRAWKTAVHHFDLENPRHLSRLQNPLEALEPLRGLIVLDEIQRRPELYPVLRVLADRRPAKTKVLVLGSASPELLRQSSESLAGRIRYLELPGFGLTDIRQEELKKLWLRGGFPRSFLASSDAMSLEWRTAFIRTFLERDLPVLGLRLPSVSLGRLWNMLAHVHGQTLNWSELGRSLGVSDTTVRHYVDVLASTFMVRLLSPWHANISKRQVKSPKVYLADSGILHALLDLPTFGSLQGHPKVGASWEGACVEFVIRALGAKRNQCFFWATHAHAELDLLVVRGTKRYGFEFKYVDAPTVTPSMKIASDDLELERLWVVYPGHEAYAMAPGIHAWPAARIPSLTRQG